MESQTPEMQAVLERLEKLDRVCAEMAQERTGLRVLEANAFILKASKGSRLRAGGTAGFCFVRLLTATLRV